MNKLSKRVRSAQVRSVLHRDSPGQFLDSCNRGQESQVFPPISRLDGPLRDVLGRIVGHHLQEPASTGASGWSPNPRYLPVLVGSLLVISLLDSLFVAGLVKKAVRFESSR